MIISHETFVSNFFSSTLNLIRSLFSLKLTNTGVNVQYLNELDKSMFWVLLEN